MSDILSLIIIIFKSLQNIEFKDRSRDISLFLQPAYHYCCNKMISLDVHRRLIHFFTLNKDSFVDNNSLTLPSSLQTPHILP